jgi:hypothetical protein
VSLLLQALGVFTGLLGLVHAFMPRLFDFRGGMPAEGPPLAPFRLLGYRYDTTRSDLRGLVWVMNHAVSYTLLSIGLADLCAPAWLGTDGGRVLAAWIAGFWFLRAGTQACLGRRRGDVLVMAWFTLLGAAHVPAALA